MLPCGGTSSTVIVLHDSGDQPITYTIASNVPGVSVSPSSGTLQPGERMQVKVTASADPIGIPSEPSSGEIQIVTDSPTAPVLVVPVTMSLAGGVLTTDQSTLDFGQVTTATSHVRTVMLNNTGNVSVSFMAGPFVDPSFAITSPTTFQIEAGASQTVDVQFTPPQSQQYAYQLPLQVTAGSMCQPLPVVNVVGTGTISAVQLDHTSIDFGAVACGASTSSRTLIMSNTNSSGYPFSTSVTTGASWFSATPGSGNLPASGMATINITRAAVTVPSVPGSRTGNLHVVVSGPPNGTNDLPLTYNVVGSALSANPGSLNFGEVQTGTAASSTVVITNSGNQVAAIQVVRTGSTTFTAPTSFQVSPGTTKNMTITFAPIANTMENASFSISASNQCSATFTIAVTGSGGDDD